ncbi:MAG: TIGR00296 family protein [Candidatus Bathyarchaeota archaeon]|nr:MAG: TIGR00296 family protein [Candidatus Bathyarchaeota archaeon]
MPFQLTSEEGSFLVKLARKAVKEFLETGEIPPVPSDTPSKFQETCGVFVTISSVMHGDKALRGCIGLPYPTVPLIRGVIGSAINSATQDPRFPRVSPGELDHLIFEVSVLTSPKLVEVKKPTDYPSKIRVGQDGLIVERGYSKGLLLPQVPVEWNWNEEEFLCQCCMKAGLTPDCWLLESTRIYTFSCIISQESSPNGKVTVKDMRTP